LLMEHAARQNKGGPFCWVLGCETIDGA
jgi:hypothetical protein